MFFYEKIKSINSDDIVLEIGPGGTPHQRSDEFLDLDPKLFKDDNEAAYQRGYAPELVTDKKLHYYDGYKMPFKNKQFDYVICAHVLEHVDDVNKFCEELFRIAPKGYIEFPSVYYEYLYDFDVHTNFMNYDKKTNTIYWLSKRESPFGFFSNIQKFFFETLVKGNTKIIDEYKNYMFIGFEWSIDDMPKVVKCSSIEEMKIITPSLPSFNPDQLNKVDNTTTGIASTTKINDTSNFASKVIAKLKGK